MTLTATCSVPPRAWQRARPTTSEERNTWPRPGCCHSRTASTSPARQRWKWACVADIGVFFIAGSVLAGEHLSIAVLPPRDDSGSAGSVHWRHTVRAMLESNLKELPNVRVLPHSTVSFAMNALG